MRGWAVVWGIVAGAIVVAGGCATHADRLHRVRSAFQQGDLETAERFVAEDLEKHPGDAEVLDLDRAVVALSDGRPQEAEQLLRSVRDRFDHLEQESAAEDAWTLFTDDQQQAYAGEDYEKVLLRALLAIANLLQDGDDAEAYSLQVAEKQREIVAAALLPDGTNPKAAYQQVALGPYLRAILREQTHRDYDDAARNFATVVSWQPDFLSGKEHLARASGSSHSRRGHGVVHIFALVGHGPCKVVAEEIPSSAALLVADQILSSQLNQTLPPTIASIKVPRVLAAPGVVGGVRVGTGGRLLGQTETLTNVSNLAVAQAAAGHDLAVARAVVRRTVKKSTIYGAKEGLGVQHFSPAALAFDLAGVAWEAAENADTRCWGLLPDTIQVLRVELPAGDHTLALQAVDRRGLPVGRCLPCSVSVADGRTSYCFVQAPDAGIIGQVLANSP